MADFTANIDGSLKLNQTESRCEVEQDGGFQLQAIRFGTIIEEGTVLQVNKAEFISKPIDRLINLTFVEVDSNDPDDLKQEKEDNGWTFICDSRIFVENHVKRVMVFGKES